MAGDYVRGDMNIKQHEGTYAGFWTATKWGTVLCILIVAGLAVFRTNTKDCKVPENIDRYPNECAKVVHGEGHSE